MKLSTWLSLTLSVVLPVLANEAPKELVIETVSKPDDCSVTAKTGDSIRVHYVRFIDLLNNSV
jgi:FK506-binding protein 2